jgi:hypothetical protein
MTSTAANFRDSSGCPSRRPRKRTWTIASRSCAKNSTSPTNSRPPANSDVEITERGLKISPIEDDTPDGAEALRFQAYHLLPRVKITDLLLEVDRWTNFSGMFSHLKTGEEHQDRTLLLTAILADAFNLGLEKMAEACPGTSLARLSWLVAWHIRDETYSKALAKLVDHQHRLPLAAHWGEGTTSSSDGQRFRAGGHGEAGGYRNAKYGDDPGVLFYPRLALSRSKNAPRAPWPLNNQSIVQMQANKSPGCALVEMTFARLL